MTEKLEIYIIEIDKVKELFKQEPNNKAYQWVMFLDDPNSEEVNYIMQRNEDISDIREDLAIVSGDEELRELTRLKEKRERDRMMIESYELSRKKAMEESKQELQEREKNLQERAKNLQAEQQKLEEEQQNFQEKQQKLEEEQQNFQEKQQKLEEERQQVQQERERLVEKIEKNSKGIASKLLKAGMSVEQITDITGLAKEEIEELHD